MASVANLAAGQAVSGAGVAAGTAISGIAGTVLNLSAPLSAAVPAGSKLSFGSALAAAAPAEVYRLSYNTYLRQHAATLGCAGLIDDDRVFADLAGSGKWRVDLGAASADGVHPAAALHQAAVNAGLITPAMFQPQ
jgi:hypothetical protein